MFAPRTIYAKGLILISVPLLLEWAFGIAMFTLEHNYREKINRERTAAEIIFHANEMWINCFDVLMLKSYFDLFGGPAPNIQERMTRFNSEYGLLKNLLADDPEQAKIVEEIRSRTYKALKLSERFHPMGNQTAGGMLSALMSNLDTFQMAFNLVDPISTAITHFREPQFFLNPAKGNQIEKASALVDLIVLWSVAGSAFAAILLFIYFIRSINRGVVSMVENTDRFKRGEELKPPLTGADELAKLDQAFHGMADEIREAQSTKKAILAMISHDLRTPLTSVLTLFTLLQIYLEDASAAAQAGAQQQEGDIEQLIRLITDLLDLEKIEAGGYPVRVKSIPVEEAISKAIATMERFSEQRGVAVRGVDSRLDISADPDRIVQAIACLVAAAIKVSPQGSVVDTSVIQNDNRVEIKVTSKGADIPADLVDSMFDRYRERTAGLGLELPLCKEIIRLHSGTVGAAPAQPKGCTLWCSLPHPSADLSVPH